MRQLLEELPDQGLLSLQQRNVRQFCTSISIAEKSSFVREEVWVSFLDEVLSFSLT